ncbi:MAG: HAD-IC family P-type ATPase [Actinomycetota bacterium]
MKTTHTTHARFDLLTPGETARRLEVDLTRGLDPVLAVQRLSETGPNELPPPSRERLAVRLARQFREPMALLLIAAAAVDGIGLREHVNAAAILSIVVLNAVIALIQEGKAARDLEALRTMETPTARVLRGGVPLVVPSSELVPGDLVLLAAGDRVPADLRLAETSSVEIDESILTGESMPVAKDSQALAREHDVLSDRVGMAYTGTLVTRGAARGVVVATGPGTELGAIAERLAGPETSTPLQADLAKLTSRLGAIAVLIAIGVFVLTFVRIGVSGDALQRAFLPAVALAVAAVPEGLATVVTVGLALGVRRMAEHGAIVRRLPAVETLGSTTFILADKTGTLTENRMRVDVVLVPAGAPVSPSELPADARMEVAEVSVLCNDAALEPPSGDPLELALLEAFAREEPDIRAKAGVRLAAAPFDSERKRMSTVHSVGGIPMLFVKGAPESILDRCVDWLRAGEVVQLDEDDQHAIHSEVEVLAGRGMRTLALARRTLARVPDDPAEEEYDLTFTGLVALRDPVRPEAAHAVAECRSAGIQLTMVTGDHAATAAAIAAEVGLAEPGAQVLTGASMRDTGVPDDPGSVPIYARVDPDQKLALVEAFQSRGEVVAVTGDGVNDAPALRRADIGVAMGRAGSDVARETSDMVVTDDNLATIVTAVREGRGIYDNLRKVVDYLVGGNLSEISVVVAALLLFPELHVPLLPLQLLWINLLTDGLPAIGLGVDPPDPGLMTHPPRRRAERLLTARRIGFLFARGLCIAGASLAGLAISRFAWNEPWPHARAVMFTVLVVAHLLYAFAVRRGAGVWSNRWLLAAIGAGVGLQFLAVAVPGLHSLFGTATLALREWALVAVLGAVPLLTMLLLLPDRTFASRPRTRMRA